MADYTKVINRALPSSERYLVITQTNVATSDIIRVEESLGRAADTVTIETAAGCDLSVQLNSKIKVSKLRNYPENEMYGSIILGESNLAVPTELDSGTQAIRIGAAGAVTYSRNDIAIRDLLVTYTTGTFTITFS